MLAGAGLIARARYDRGGWNPNAPRIAREVRDYRRADHGGPCDFAVAHGAEAPPPRPTPVTQAVAALGGMARFISRGDIVVVKFNIGWGPHARPGGQHQPE